ncbi:chlorite dismutase family protein [Erythrobacter sp. NE805]|uniref:chlorite dismutase family protein n=1 Tax=Erythrobacter sp. NE805 TaxID=3389875 RepID=UPI00396AFAF1
MSYGARVLYAFDGGARGDWAVTAMTTLTGESLPAVAALSVRQGSWMEAGGAEAPEPVWSLCGVASHLRYTLRAEFSELSARGSPLGRGEARRAALIPISKSEAWWALAQDERRRIYEEQSRHTSIGMEYLPQIARRLHHGRDLGEPFDFLTWFEFAPEHESLFDDLLVRLRASEEWTYVTREIDIRLSRVD